MASVLVTGGAGYVGSVGRVDLLRLLLICGGPRAL